MIAIYIWGSESPLKINVLFESKLPADLKAILSYASSDSGSKAVTEIITIASNKINMPTW